MPVSIAHEARALLLRENPGLVALFCTRLGIKIPEGCRPVLSSEDCTITTPVELTRDRTIRFESEAGVTELAVCCEIQLRVDESRRWAWPLYLAKLRFDLKCPVVLLVLTPDPAVLRWCAKGFHLGHPGLILCPLGIGPDDIDHITSPEDARNNLELAVLSALAHGDTPQGLAILDTVVDAMDSTDLDKAHCYTELLLSALKENGRKHLEHLMMTKDFEYTSDFALRLIAQGEAQGVAQGVAQGMAQGVAQGEAKSIFLVLKARGVPITQHARDRIRACTDLRQLERWVERAALVENVDELFTDES